MKKCDQGSLAVDYFFKELDPVLHEQYQRHLSHCDLCQQHIQYLAETKRVVGKYRRRKPDKALLRDYHFALAQRYDTVDPSRAWWDRMVDIWIKRPSIGVRLAEAVVLILIGFFIGTSKSWLARPEATPSEANHAIDILVNESPILKSYLRQTEMILLDVKNLDPMEDQQLIFNLIQSAQYRYLLQKTLLLREQAREIEDMQLDELLNRIELILLELENVSMTGDVEILSLVQQQVKDTKLLLQIKAMNQEGI
ncbi:MAG: hypothetical protein ONB13_07655 [candidate division KSB1 bacterium]|nr:hypothetical protein [candidate division KSB1 bacterium]MDZ7376481.1 hypothetical protein [candidate division KSB1 bacterium]MDZ7402024.1 hypothetical protein [candidate division KSB1 bacterium]